MKYTILPVLALLLWTAAASPAPLVIAHRGASAYLPEHSLAGKAMAHAMGADYIEQDVVLTRDGVAIVFHDLYLDAMTDVSSRFEGRARADGRHYVIDFSHAEIRSLALHERVQPEDGKQRYPRRFPASSRIFRIPTLVDELQLLQGLNQATGRRVGVYVELKNPRWHSDHGQDIVGTVLPLLHRFGYRDASDRAFLQSFDAATLRRIRQEDLSRLPLIQLIGENRWWPDADTDYDYLKTVDGLEQIKTYAAGIGPWYRQILLGIDPSGNPRYSRLVDHARAAGLKVHTYTLRADTLPEGVGDFDTLLGYLLVEKRVDGVFTDHPDRVRRFVGRD